MREKKRASDGNEGVAVKGGWRRDSESFKLRGDELGRKPGTRQRSLVGRFK